MNVIDEYKGWEPHKIKQKIKNNTFPYAVMMQHIGGDYNISTLIRNANAFGASEVFYYGRRKWDRRGSVGTHHYTDLIFLPDLENLTLLKEKYHFVGIENNLPTGYKPKISIRVLKYKETPTNKYGKEI